MLYVNYTSIKNVFMLTIINNKKQAVSEVVTARLKASWGQGLCLWLYPFQQCFQPQHTYKIVVVVVFSHLVMSGWIWLCHPMDYIAFQAPLSMGFPRQEHWSGLPCLPPGDLPDPGIEPQSPALMGRFLTTESSGNPFTDNCLVVEWRGLCNSNKLWAMPCRATQDRWVIVESSDKTRSTVGGNGNHPSILAVRTSSTV